MAKSVFLFTWLIPVYIFAAFSPIENDLRPDYTLVNLRPSGFAPKVADLGWMSDGKLVVVHWSDVINHVNRQFDGKIYLLSGVQEATGPNGVNVQTFKQGIEDPLGIWVLNDTIWTSSGMTLSGHVDTDGNGTADEEIVLYDFNYQDKCRHEFFFGLVYKDGYFYATASRCKDDPDAPGGSQPATWQMHPGRGAHMKISKATGEAEIIAGGFREPYGMSLGPLGDIFESDNQGNWLPSSKLINPKQGRFYGFQADNYTPQQDYGNSFNGVQESPPTLWLPHTQASHSPSHPVYVDHGVYKGQMLMGDVAYGGIQRGFLEMVGGDWQGAVFNWTGGLEAGVSSMVWGEDGSLYVGGIGLGQDNNWGWHGTYSGLQKMVPKQGAPVVFEMLEVRSRADGMEIVFTKPVGSGVASPNNFSIRRSQQLSSFGYGAGNGVNAANVNITGASLSPDGYRVHLQTDMNSLRGGNSLQPMVVLDITANSGVRSQDGDALWVSRAWYTLNKISTSQAFAINGCTDPGYAEYNPEANFEDGTCRNQATSAQERPRKPQFPGIRRIEGAIEISVTENLAYQIRVLTLDGKLVTKQSGSGPQVHRLDIPKKGVYVVRLQMGGQDFSRKMTVF